jgi:hypothetical protein
VSHGYLLELRVSRTDEAAVIRAGGELRAGQQLAAPADDAGLDPATAATG